MDLIDTVQDCTRAALPALCAIAGGDPHAGEVLRRAFGLGLSWLVFFFVFLPLALALSTVFAYLGANYITERLLGGK